jgi:signal transduction histidine kinase
MACCHAAGMRGRCLSGHCGTNACAERDNHVGVHYDGEKLHVDVRDDGQGFDPGHLGTRGAGLPSLRARASRLGATLCVTSSPENGTHLSFRIT